MRFDPLFLQQLWQNTIVGDFSPFAGGTLADTEQYVRSIVGMLESLPGLRMGGAAYYNSNDPDGQWDGSWQSYVLVSLFRTTEPDHRDWSAIEVQNPLTRNVPAEHNPDALLLYICLLSPHWFYTAPDYTLRQVRNGIRMETAAGVFPTPQPTYPLDAVRWQTSLKAISEVFSWFQYQHFFDCFFHHL
jgi:hypothetical protein